MVLWSQRWEGIQVVNERHSPGLHRRRLGRLLTRFREQAGLSLVQAADPLYSSKAALSRIENGEQRINPHLLKSMLDLYQISADRWDGLIQMALYTKERGWWHEYGGNVAGLYVDLETEAEEILDFGLAMVPGLLQTADYASVLIRRFYQGRRDIEDLVRRHVAVRMARQERLTADRPLKLTVVLDESALMRSLGSQDVLVGQLVHLAEVAQLPNVGIRVLPLDRVHPGLEGAFSIMRFAPDIEEPDMVYHQYPFNEQFLDKPEQTSVFHRLFRDLWDDALSQEDSIELFRRHAEL
jgi:transcriptional regulator with XRE-family HTH domain